MNFICYSEPDTVGAYLAKPAWSEAYGKALEREHTSGTPCEIDIPRLRLCGEERRRGQVHAQPVLHHGGLQGLDSAVVNFDDVGRTTSSSELGGSERLVGWLPRHEPAHRNARIEIRKGTF